MRKMAIIAASTWIGACQSPVQSHGDIVRKALSEVTYDNGVSMIEGKVIADAYLYVYGTHLGPAPYVKIRQGEGFWIGDVYTGTGVSPVPANASPVHVSIATGEVTWEQGPTVQRIDFTARGQPSGAKGDT